MNPRQIFLNAVTTFTQELLCAGILFLLYRFLIRTLGIERFGVWSIVLATTSVVTLANQGFSASIVKFVAKYAAQEKSNHVATLLETATLTTGLAAAVAMVGLYPAARSLLKLLLPIGAVAEARQVLPFALVSLWLNLVGGVLLAGLAGLQKITYRNYIIT